LRDSVAIGLAVAPSFVMAQSKASTKSVDTRAEAIQEMTKVRGRVQGTLDALKRSPTARSC